MKKEEKKTNKKREINGVVISNSMSKVVRVQVDTLESHPVYKKIVRRKKVFFARTEKDLNIGDKVTIRESRPLSKNVRWIVVEKEK
ncbi:mitochondrial small ribosomal subunit protein uS17m [bacterium]|nr:mitochondrial small ribosomal subunit protein uS17m [bacterium]